LPAPENAAATAALLQELVIELRKVGSYKRRDYSSNGT
jgi:hypothetical protein